MTDLGFEFEHEMSSNDPRRKTALYPCEDGEGWWREELEQVDTDDDGDVIWRRLGIESVEDLEFRKAERPAVQLDDAPDPAAATDGGPRDD